jgi:FkbM family methyltransferase
MMPRWWNKRRFDVLEVLLIVVAAAVAGYVVQRMMWVKISYPAFSAAQEAAALERYGPGRYSRNVEEWIIRDYFRDGRHGYFVDVGASHYKADSNTYYLETRLGWSGLAIDPQGAFAADYRRYRPRTRFFSFFVSDTSDATTTFYLTPDNPLVASSDRGFAEREGTEIPGAVLRTKAVTVPTIRLTDLLDRVGVTHIDLLSVDVELAEPKVLAGFDIERFKPTLVVIEAHPRVRQQILDYFSDHHYVALGRYLRADLQNLYFTPLQNEQTRRVAAR